MPMPPLPTPVFASPKTEAIKLLCCINQGRMTVGAYSSDTTLHRGEGFSLAVAMQNESSANVERLIVEIEERVKWTAQNHHDSCTRQVAYAEFDADQVEGTDALDKEGLQAVKEGGSDGLRSVMQAVHSKLASCTQSTNLTTDPTARDTYLGGVLSITHTLKVLQPAIELGSAPQCALWKRLRALYARAHARGRSFRLSGQVRCKTGRCITDPVVVIPVRIGAPPIAPPVMPVAQAVTTTTAATTTLYTSLRAPPPDAVPVVACASHRSSSSPKLQLLRVPSLLTRSISRRRLPDGYALDKDEAASVAFVEALPADWQGSVVVADAVVLPMATAVIGGVALDGGEAADEQLLMGSVVAEKPPAGTLETLTALMASTVDDLRALLGLLEGEDKAAWEALFSSLHPLDYGRLVGQVNMESTQPGTVP